MPFLARLAREVPLVRYFKIEVPGTAAKLRALIEAGGDAIAGPVRRRGVDHADGRPRRRRDRHDAERAAARPDQAGPRRTIAPGGAREAAAAYARILPLINYENRQCGLRATKTVMAEGGVIAATPCAIRSSPASRRTRAGLLELAREANPLALRWGAHLARPVRGARAASGRVAVPW